MTPSNNPNGEPLIYRICDAAGVFHLVAPVNHTHLTTEVSGLTEALAAKANAAAVETALAGKMDNKTIDYAPTANSTNLVTSGGVKAALDGKRDLVGETISLVVNGQEIEIESSDVPNLIRALSNPDNTPTANSTNLVTSGGVKNAIDNADAVHYKHEFYYIGPEDKISVNDLESGFLYVAKIRTPISKLADIFNENDITICGIDNNLPNVSTVVFRYFAVETDIQETYQHFVSVLAYKTSSFEPV